MFFSWLTYTSLGIQSPCQMMIGVYNHLRNARYLGSMKPFSEGEPGSLGPGMILQVFTRFFRVDSSGESAGFTCRVDSRKNLRSSTCQAGFFKAKIGDSWIPKKTHRIHGTGIFTPWKINGWNLQITHKKKGK